MRYILIILATVCCSISGKAQTDSVKVSNDSINHTMASVETISKNSQRSFGLNKDLGVAIGYSYVHSPLKGDYFVGMAPQNIISIDAWLWCVYLGIEGLRHKTGYEVYGFNESVGLFIFKLGPVFKADIGKNKMYFGPYIGGAWADVKDSSNNSIGARTDYGNHAKGFVIGARLGLRLKKFVASIHGSNREVGFSVGFAFDPGF